MAEKTDEKGKETVEGQGELIFGKSFEENENQNAVENEMNLEEPVTRPKLPRASKSQQAKATLAIQNSRDTKPGVSNRRS